MRLPCPRCSACAAEHAAWALQVKQNVQRTLAMELQKLSVQFRKQQKKYLQDIKQRDAPPGTGGQPPQPCAALRAGCFPRQAGR